MPREAGTDPPLFLVRRVDLPPAALRGLRDPSGPAAPEATEEDRMTSQYEEIPGQLALGEALRDQGVQVADQNAGDWWRSCADQAIDALAALGEPFTADDVRGLGVPDPVSPKAWGARFLMASRQGRIVRVGYVPSKRASVHAHPIALWRGAA